MRPLVPAVLLCSSLACAPKTAAPPAQTAAPASISQQASLVIRTDDAGMSHSVNVALGVSGYFGEAMGSPQYVASPASKGDSLVALINRLPAGVNVVVTHVGMDDPELGALLDMNTAEPLADMSKNRQGELDALTSKRFRDALEARRMSC